MQDSRRYAVPAILTALTLTATALGQDSVTASALFDKGLADMKKGQYDTGCPAIAESYRLDPQPGALYTLATCEARWGKIASAAAHFDEFVQSVARMPAAQQGKQKGRVKTANDQIAQLKPKIPELTIKLPENAPPGTTVIRDDVMLRGPSIGTALPVDPGEHIITTQVPGGEPHKQKVSIALSEKKTIEAEIVLPPPPPETASASASAVPPPPPPSTATVTPSNVTTQKPPPPPPPPKKSNTLAYVFGGIGIVGLAAGGVTGYLAMQKKSKVDDNCTGTDCNHTGYTAAEDGKKFALVSTIGFGVGAAGIVGATILFIAGGGSSEPQPATTGTRVRPFVTSNGTNGALMGVHARW